MTCSSGCFAPGTHSSYGECLQSKNLRRAFADSVNNKDLTKAKRFESRLEKYRRLRAQGIQPRTTGQRDVDMADLASNERGAAYRADKSWDYAPTIGQGNG